MKILSIYVLRQFIATLVFSIVALCLIFLIVNLLENLDEFLDQNADISLIVEYYMSFFPEILKILTPIATLMATLFTIGRLSTNNEITAMKTGGMSLYRLMLPLLVFCLLLSFGQLYFNGWIVPKANTKKLDIEIQYLRKNMDKRGGPIHNLYFRDSPLRNVVIYHYDANNKRGSKISIEDYSNEKKPRLTRKIDAVKILWDSSATTWKLITCIDRKIDGNIVTTKTIDTLPVKLNITHDEICKLKKSTEEMTFDEFKNYIRLLKQGGKDVTRLTIEYYGNYAFPFANVIVILFGVPFASVRKKGGIAIQIGAAMVFSFLYLVFTKLSQTLGYSLELNPIIAGWLANIIFIILGIYIIYRTRT